MRRLPLHRAAGTPKPAHIPTEKICFAPTCTTNALAAHHTDHPLPGYLAARGGAAQFSQKTTPLQQQREPTAVTAVEQTGMDCLQSGPTADFSRGGAPKARMVASPHERDVPAAMRASCPRLRGPARTAAAAPQPQAPRPAAALSLEVLPPPPPPQDRRRVAVVVADATGAAECAPGDRFDER